MQKSNRFSRATGMLILLFIAATASMGIYLRSNPCDIETVERASTFLARQRDSFDHSYQFATSASRDAIVRPVAELQQILMDTLEYPVPVCMRTAKNELIRYMGAVIRAFLAYGAQEPDAAIRDWLDQSGEHYDNFSVELQAVNECAPLCIFKMRP